MLWSALVEDRRGARSKGGVGYVGNPFIMPKWIKSKPTYVPLTTPGKVGEHNNDSAAYILVYRVCRIDTTFYLLGPPKRAAGAHTHVASAVQTAFLNLAAPKEDSLYSLLNSRWLKNLRKHNRQKSEQ